MDRTYIVTKIKVTNKSGTKIHWTVMRRFDPATLRTFKIESEASEYAEAISTSAYVPQDRIWPDFDAA